MTTATTKRKAAGDTVLQELFAGDPVALQFLEDLKRDAAALLKRAQRAAERADVTIGAAQERLKAAEKALLSAATRDPDTRQSVLEFLLKSAGGVYSEPVEEDAEDDEDLEDDDDTEDVEDEDDEDEDVAAAKVDEDDELIRPPTWIDDLPTESAAPSRVEGDGVVALIGFLPPAVRTAAAEVNAAQRALAVAEDGDKSGALARELDQLLRCYPELGDVLGLERNPGAEAPRLDEYLTVWQRVPGFECIGTPGQFYADEMPIWLDALRRGRVPLVLMELALRRRRAFLDGQARHLDTRRELQATGDGLAYLASWKETAHGR